MTAARVSETANNVFMKAMVVTQFGGPEVLKLQEASLPAPGAHDLLIEAHACGLNPIDFKVRRGALAKDRPQPIILDEVYSAPSLVRNGANAEFVCVDARMAAHKPKTLDHVQAAALPLVTITAWEALRQRARIRNGETILIHAGGGGVGHVAL
ncbi:MAG: NADPH:quinone reductase, partial [Verrucomicrobia bacterium]